MISIIRDTLFAFAVIVGLLAFTVSLGVAGYLGTEMLDHGNLWGLAVWAGILLAIIGFVRTVSGSDDDGGL